MLKHGFVAASILALAATALAGPASAQTPKALSIVTGGTGGELGEAFGHREAEPARGAGHDRDLAGHVE